MKLYEIVEFLDDLLKVKEWQDKSNNGLQVEGKEEIKKVAFAVDACMDVFERAKESNADMIVVHHGLIWGGIDYVKGVVKRRLEFLLKNGISLYAVHLPLDAHPSLGNNAQILKALGLEPTESFGVYQGKEIGYIGVYDESKPLEDVLKVVRENINESLMVLDFGSRNISRIGVVSGRGCFALVEAVEKKVDLFITGEQDHSVYHLAKECGINVVFAGHYATETFGVKALMRVIAGEFDVDVEFIDVPTGL
ncbi:Nif3-like dinuclear metal center hexameric protein [Archaeoglobus sp.]